MKRKIIIILIALAMLSGCTAHIYKGGIEPISPELKTFGRPFEIIDNLTPTFRWKSDATPPCTYDFAIWDVAERAWETVTTKESAIYYKEALAKPEHTIEIPLGPDTIYFWSVRNRCNDSVSAWAKRDYYVWYIVGSQSGHNWPYEFKTPKVNAK